MVEKILFIGADKFREYNCQYYRIDMPYKALRKIGAQADFIHVEDWEKRTPRAEELTNAADLIIFQRNVFGMAFLELVRWVSVGKVVCIDMDDSYEYMTDRTGSPSSAFWIDGKIIGEDKKEYVIERPFPIETLLSGVKVCGLVSSPSKLICSDWSGLARSFHMPNYIETSSYKKKYDIYKEPGRIRIGWMGSASHMESWVYSGLIDAVVKIIKERKNVDLLIGGDARALGYMKNSISPSRRIELGWIPNALIAKNISRFDIGVIPVSGNYDRRRSSLKPLEFTAAGIPWVGSDAEPNWDFRNSGTLIQNTAENWYNAISQKIDNLEQEKQRAVENVSLAAAWDIGENAERIYGTLKEIFEVGRERWARFQ